MTNFSDQWVSSLNTYNTNIAFEDSLKSFQKISTDESYVIIGDTRYLIYSEEKEGKKQSVIDDDFMSPSHLAKIFKDKRFNCDKNDDIW